MKSTQILSVVFSLILFAGVTAGSAAFAELDDKLEDFCEMTDEEKVQFFVEYPDIAKFEERLAVVCEIEDEDERESTLDDVIDAIVLETRDEDDINEDNDRHNLDDKLEDFCEMTDEEKVQFFVDHPRLEQFSDRITNHCNMSEDERDIAIDAFLEEHKMLVDEMKDNQRAITDHRKEYDRFCKLTDEELAASTFDAEFVEKASQWCDMTPEERDEYNKEHHDAAMDFKDKHHDALDRMKNNPDISQRIRAMIMEHHDISDERIKDLRIKYEEKHGDLDEKRSELRMKFKDHMAEMRIQISQEHKSAILDRVAEMKAFKMDLRERASELTDEDKQELRAQFIEKAKDMQLAWISPRAQTIAGIDTVNVECREGFSLVMKESNGVPMCLRADTALKLIDRGIVVPAN